MEHSLKKGRLYVIEWVDPTLIVKDVDPNEIKERITTYGKYIGETDNRIYIAIQLTQDDNVVKIPTKCVMSVVEVDEGGSGFGTIFCVLMFFAVSTSLYYTFNPPQFVINNLIDEIDKHYSIIIEDNGTSH